MLLIVGIDFEREQDASMNPLFLLIGKKRTIYEIFQYSECNRKFIRIVSQSID